jgi:hypothetical protein
MIKKLTRYMLAMMTTTICVSAHAVDNYNSCTVQVAVSNPPILPDENVAFNVTGENGINKAITLKGNSAPQTIENITCSESPYYISATKYSTYSNLPLHGPWIGQCTLKAGPVLLYGENNIISVVFPNDFFCA